MQNLYTVWNSAKKVPKIISERVNFFKSEAKGAALGIIKDICHKDNNAHFEVLGGDGSVYEACNAIMESGYNESVNLTVVPNGTGNDFIKNFDQKNPKQRRIDLIKFNQSYAANEINMGFDCDVVIATDKIKKLPLCKGSIAYIFGVIKTLFGPIGKEFEFEYTDENGEKSYYKGDLLLCILGNGAYYGGGFKCAPRASVDDGLLELVFVKKVSKLAFLTFVLGYKNGKHILENGEINKRYKDILTYKRIKFITLKNVGTLCADGEIISVDDVNISVVPKAINLYN